MTLDKQAAGAASMVIIQEGMMEEVPLSDEENGIEYKVLMAYAKRQLSDSRYQRLVRNGNVAPAMPEAEGATGHGATSNGSGSDGIQSAANKKKKTGKKQKRWRRLIPSCVRAEEEMGKKKDKVPAEAVTADSDTNRANAIAHRLQKIIKSLSKTNELEFRSFMRETSIEADGDDNYEQLIREIALVLRSSGDHLNDQIKAEQKEKISGAWSYGFFQRLTDFYLQSSPSSKMEEPETQSSKVALCIDVTTRLTALESLPPNKVMVYGAKYLKEKYTSWIEDQGGWEKAMGIEEELD
ncbi:apoptosis facilitator Bcl-2-like protein 14 isoform X1 [Xenopus tropicalis]|uniref:Apoptosis facilitator Bcl-2-like protein 14 isoform X1 n=2 Tax=Xenopus tropicalis TaxID=8364 RepID=G1K3F0_XENTR|nr:apoptosis facilitator Bcl-2-like protein 14 isoform X1 [Xenopus tropicalis]|eukprot:XP_012814041.1 PREDICTED: apoptosis facilitator Bcl-2-like protein 14 isoform X1 [Xenopus tropicalis]